uniref:RBR-type E3 ubiquitin transferase n=1 Tax=Lactuca sativa TaxID=4236 RepID=A0A9R1XUU3_LACSA|nr:hypothetical protein LSAT_V11C100016250 [Lactuca sativa]
MIIDLADEIFPISDEKYAQELQLQETLTPSASKRNASSSSQNVASSSSIPATFTPPNKLKRKQAMLKAEEATLHERICGICMDTKALPEIFSNAKVCGHLFCSDCISQHVYVKIKENIAKVKCPDPTCKGLIGPEVYRDIVAKEVLERWEDALCESTIMATQKLYCPFKDCSAMLVDDSGEVVTSAECPNCHRLFCAQCKVAWHSRMDCREYKRLKEYERNPKDLMLMELAKNKKWKKNGRNARTGTFMWKSEAVVIAFIAVVIFNNIVKVNDWSLVVDVEFFLIMDLERSTLEAALLFITSTINSTINGRFKEVLNLVIIQ